MMTYKQRLALFKTLSFPVYYDHAPIGQTVPFGVLNVEQQNNFAADNVVYFEAYNAELTCYFEKKDAAKEAEVKKLLNDNEMPFSVSEMYADDAVTYAETFEFGFLAGE